MILFAYDRAQTLTIVRDWSVDQLLSELHAGWGTKIDVDKAHDLIRIATAWQQRAMGLLSLRDVLMIDSQRGPLAYQHICHLMAHTTYQLTADEATIVAPSSELGIAEIGAALVYAYVTPSSGLADLLRSAEQDGLTLATAPGVAQLPAELEQLLPPPPQPWRTPTPNFVPPSGRRRALGLTIVLSGVAWLLLPLVTGQLPIQPAGVPLALLTLGLLFGIHAQWMGYLGALCIWLVANLPGFRFSTLPALWQWVPLFTIGITLLALDSNVRALWRWIRARGWRK